MWQNPEAVVTEYIFVLRGFMDNTWGPINRSVSAPSVVRACCIPDEVSTMGSGFGGASLMFDGPAIAALLGPASCCCDGFLLVSAVTSL